MANLSNKLKQHAKAAANMSPVDVTKSVWNIAGNTLKYSLQAVGASAYIVDKSIQAIGSVGKQAYEEAKDGYHTTDELLSSSQEQEPTRSKPVGSDANRPQQLEMDI